MSEFLQSGRPPLILASSSRIRAELLERAGLSFIAEAPGLDEATMRLALDGEALGPTDIAEVLARAKAEAVSEIAKDAFVIGADQVLALDGKVYGKCETMEEARARLLEFSGKTHQLLSAVAVARNGETVWATTDQANMAMRKLSPEYIGRYLAAAGEEVLGSVGVYQLEGLGVQLFDKIEGSYFTILGLPLLPLLAALREQGAITS